MIARQSSESCQRWRSVEDRQPFCSPLVDSLERRHEFSGGESPRAPIPVTEDPVDHYQIMTIDVKRQEWVSKIDTPLGAVNSFAGRFPVFTVPTGSKQRT